MIKRKSETTNMDRIQAYVLPPMSAKRAMEESKSLADAHDSISYVGGGRPDIAKADPDYLVFGDEVDEVDDEPGKSSAADGNAPRAK